MSILTDMDDATGKELLIRNLWNGLYLRELRGIGKDVMVVQDGAPPLGDTDGYVWLVYDLDVNLKMLVNRKSGKVMGRPTEEDDNVNGIELMMTKLIKNEPAISQMWRILPLGAEEGEHFEFRNTVHDTELCMGVKGYSEKPGDRIILQISESISSKHRAQFWVFETLNEYDAVVAAAKHDLRAIEDIGCADKIRPDFSLSSKTTKSVLLGQLVLPFFLVNDPGRIVVKEQRKQSPFYVLKRYGYRRKIHFIDHSGDSTTDILLRVPVGLLGSNADLVKHIVGISVCPRSGRSTLLRVRDTYWGNILSKLGADLNIVVGTEGEYPSVIIEKMNVNFPNDQIRRAHAVWYLECVYVLRDSHEVELLRWTIRGQKCIEPTEKNPIIKLKLSPSERGETIFID